MLDGFPQVWVLYKQNFRGSYFSRPQLGAVFFFVFWFRPKISITTTQHVQSHQIAQNVILSLEFALIVKMISFQVDSVASQSLLLIQHWAWIQPSKTSFQSKLSSFQWSSQQKQHFSFERKKQMKFILEGLLFLLLFSVDSGWDFIWSVWWRWRCICWFLWTCAFIIIFLKLNPVTSTRHWFCFHWKFLLRVCCFWLFFSTNPSRDDTLGHSSPMTFMKRTTCSTLPHE